MHTLRLTQHSVGENQYKVEIALEGGQFRQSAVSEFEFSLSPQEQESIRWYLEDYPLFRFDPAPKIAARVETRMAEIGRELFRHVFQASDDARDIWADLRRNVNDARVEIITEVREATAIPWELLRDPKTDKCLSLHAASFVHSNFNPAQPFQMAETGEGPIRILLAICRPSGRSDVPFRSVASQLIKGLSDADRNLFHLDVLRPATYDALGKQLRRAKDAGTPYHVVHFDGHGAFGQIGPLVDSVAASSGSSTISPHQFDAAVIYPKTKRDGKHGYLCFENPDHSENLRFVDGEDIGNLLSETGVPVLVLNACRSAHAEAPEKPEENPDAAGTDPHAQTRAFGPLAQEIVNAGTAGVVAMRYNVYVVTAAQFVADLYGSLIAGNPLGKAVTLGRKALSDKPIREITGDALALQDWCVPVVYEAGPIALFPEQTAEKSLKITLTDSRATPSRGHLDPDLPPTPDAGFWGRDETLLALDRAFDDHGVVLLHAYAGSGKTAAVAEFARWYALTGGVEGPVLFTSFEQYKPLARVLDKFGQVFGPTLEQQAGINWLARSDDERREIALQVMGQVPVLWTWDNVEPVAGFPTGAASAWSADEQKELADFLRAARDTKAKILLTSRRNEKPWLGGLPVRITLPAMPMHEREQMARGLAKNHGRRLRDLKAWRPLLRFTDGNPLTLTVLAGQALRDGLTSEAQIEGFVEKLSRGETAFEDEETEGRTKSLAASLNYGFENAFSEEERKVLSLLYFFQGFVNVLNVFWMCNPESRCHLSELSGYTYETTQSILDRAAEIGLLTALGNGYYTIHPVLPWFLKSIFENFYPKKSIPELAFLAAIEKLGDYCAVQYETGNRSVVKLLMNEEPNLLFGWRMARAAKCWKTVTSAMQGLRSLYSHKGRRIEWKRLVEETMPDFIAPNSDAPVPGQEDHWSIVTNFRVMLMMDEAKWDEALRLQTKCVAWDREKAAPYLNKPTEKMDKKEKNLVRTLAASLTLLSGIQRERGEAECIKTNEEAFLISKRTDDNLCSAVCAFNIGHAYLTLPTIYSLENAGNWYGRALELIDPKDKLGLGKCYNQLGAVAFERLKEARETQRSRQTIVENFKTAQKHCNTAVDLIPADAVSELAVAHNQLGLLYSLAGEIDEAIPHLQKSLANYEKDGNSFNAGQTRRSIAAALAKDRRIHDALDYAHAALRDFEMYGDWAAADIERTKGLIQALSELG